MHQGHNIPWSLLEKHFTFTNDDKRFTPPFTGLVLNSTPGAQSDLRHLVNKLVSTIKEFSDTERKKYPAKFAPIPPDSKVFSDALRDKHPEYLSEETQPLSYWIRATAGYNTVSHGKLMDAVNVLLYENEMSTLLMLAQHPEVSMGVLHYDTREYAGFCRSQDSALWAYLFFNTMEAVGCLMNGAYARTRDYEQLIRQISHSIDFSGGQVAHREFLRSCGLLDKESGETLVHLHYDKLQKYLKVLFAIMYRYDVLAREIGITPDWDIVMKTTHPFTGQYCWRRHLRIDQTC